MATLKQKRAAGKPRKFETPADIAQGILDYVDNCTEKHQMPNKAGLCIWLNISRDTYNEYKKRDGYGMQRSIT